MLEVCTTTGCSSGFPIEIHYMGIDHKEDWSDQWPQWSSPCWWR